MDIRSIKENHTRLLALCAVLAWAAMLYPHPYTVIMAGSVACLTMPLFRFLRERLSRGLSLVIYISLLALCILLPITIVIVLVAPQAINGIRTLSAWVTNGFPMPDGIRELFDKIYTMLSSIPGFTDVYDQLTQNLQSVIASAAKSILSGSLGFAGVTLSGIWQAVLMLILASLAVMYAPTLFKLSVRMTSLPEDSAARMIKAARSALRAVFIGIVFVACIQGLLTGIGLAFLGVEDSAFWGMMAVFAAVIPVLGTALIWGPMAIVLWVQGSPMSAVILVVWGTVVVSGADSIIRPYFLKTGIETSILVLFLSIICAMSAFGAIGLILGPVLVALAIQAVHESDILAEKEQYS